MTSNLKFSLAIIAAISMGYAAYVAIAGGGLDEAKAAVAGKLKDPGSAQFRGVRQVKEMVCGEVNAKNRLGGYEGFRAFFYDPKIHKAFIPGGTSITDDVLDSLAKSADVYCK